MHDPCTLAFDIYLGSKKKKSGHYRTPFISIWHKDPEKDGTDDSCGWFIRSRHVDKKLLEKVVKEVEFQFKHEYWFNDGGYPKFSVMGLTLEMYSNIAWKIFIYLNDDNPSNACNRRYKLFMRKYLFDILHFAENPIDSLCDSINMKYGVEDKKERIHHFANVITTDILRKMRPWYKHPRWHVHHWHVTFPVFRDFYRRYFERCDRCKGKIGTQSVYTDWNGTEHWCERCNGSTLATTNPNLK